MVMALLRMIKYVQFLFPWSVIFSGVNYPVRTKLNYNPPKADGSTYRIELQGVSMAIMKQILDYIFSGEVSVEALKSKKWHAYVLRVVSTSNCFLSILICCCRYLFGLYCPTFLFVSLPACVRVPYTNRSLWVKRPSRRRCRHLTCSSWPTSSPCAVSS